MSLPPPPPMRTVRVCNVSLSATPQDIQEFFSFSGIIEHIEMKSVNHRSQTAFVTFKDYKGAETAVLLSGATVVDQSVEIALEPDYVLPSIAMASPASSVDRATHERSADVGAAASTVQKAEDVVSSMLANGYILGKDAVDRAKAFDEKHQVTAKVAELDQRIGLSEKVSIGATIVNDKVRDVDHKYQVSEKTKSALTGAGSAVMKNRYVLTGATWVAGAFSRVSKAAGEVGQKTMDKVSEEQQLRRTTTTTTTRATNNTTTTENSTTTNNNNAQEAATPANAERP
ncbi:binding partner of ACD11 1 isoform X2 [Andrographis paniculata]|uniref:binding partner of ACD11 1 isoform X2 n=1 Tax=Andrographis paniculata TaxID=175694 RepID=UPI0021E8E4E4|nr:binding partner of ACD11 1 isoform X2 [Andrographis paniculata]